MIYFVEEARENGLIKIGYAKSDVQKRVKTMQTGNPSYLLILNVIEGTKRTETQLHRRFSHARQRIAGGGRKRRHARGEWFRQVPELLAYLESLPPYPPPVIPMELIADPVPILPRRQKSTLI